MSNIMPNGVVLIGPPGVGKTTLGRQLAKHLHMPFHDLSDDTQKYRGSAYPSHRKVAQIYTDKGYGAVIRYKMPHLAGVVERALLDYGKSVVELGHFHSIYEGDHLLNRVQRSLSVYDQVVLILPSPDLEQSLQVLATRNRVIYRGHEWYEYFARHRSNQRLAKHIIYTQGKTPIETCQEVIDRLDHNSQTVILMGPMGAGKTTIGKLLSERLMVEQIPLDGIRRTYYEEVGYREREEKRIASIEGFSGVLDYWNKFDTHAVRRVLEDHANCVIDFGAGQSVYDNEADLEKAEMLLSPFPNVFLLMPSPDIDESVAVLRERMEEQTRIDGKNFYRFLLTHPSNEALSTMTVYMEGHTVDDVIKSIVQRNETNTGS